MDIIFWTTDWIIQNGPLLYQIYMLNWIISRGVPGFATGSPCGVWGRGWTTCHLYDGPLSGLWFPKILVGMYFWYSGEDFIYDIFYLFLVFILPKFCLLFFPSLYFYSEVTFYIKYFVLPYSIDVISTLPYRNECTWYCLIENVMHSFFLRSTHQWQCAWLWFLHCHSAMSHIRRQVVTWIDAWCFSAGSQPVNFRKVCKIEMNIKTSKMCWNSPRYSYR